MTNILLIVAAGRGHRAGEGLPKQYRQLGGKTVLSHTLANGLSSPLIDFCQVVIHPDDHEFYAKSAKESGHSERLLPPVHGGAERQDSVRLGLEKLSSMAPQTVLIHDGARPFLETELIADLIETIAEDGVDGCLPGLPVVDTIKRANEAGMIISTEDRSNMWRAQTPQCFEFEKILAAHRRMEGRSLTDDAAVAEQSGLSVKLVTGSARNIKLTTPQDFDEAARLLNDSEKPLSRNALTSRVGFGFDVHQFETGEEIILCGIGIPHTHRLKGHSDADAGLHAITDAVLGAIGEGDIGDHFPPSDDRWKGAPSALFLEHARDLVVRRGGRIVHVDVTLICERPKIKPHREAMRRSIAEILDMDMMSVSVKATTTEGLGYTGRQEGLAAHAVATVEVP